MLYFIAIVAPEAINNQVLEWKQYMLQTFHCRVALKSPAHITLIPPFQLPGTKHHELEEVLPEFAARQPRFPIQLKNFAAFKPRVIYVHVQPNTHLSGLQARLEAYLIQTDFPIKKEDRPYHPHVTIANRDLQAADFPIAWQHFQQRPYEASFVAHAISLLRHNGQTWEVANSFPLGN
ncbi:RNA 2',3'-cyclic phosphodiesterase [Niastella populi]|uniref:2'-5' RNA ligase n=1 Tax=Niastella populi TaxID=550983 RepID=A0A1V9F5R1_9BACT|nr:RNA 2',3'-cyclic phosphodiesterase [Niastella populi]OQP53733.1 2'-5' RNA ligase [Niastella populi]